MPTLTRITVMHDANAETLWAEALSGDLYRIDSIPFQTSNISLGDIVRAVMRDGALQFEQLYDKSGNQTVLISVDTRPGSDAAERVLRLITGLRLRHETAAGRFIAVNVPPDVPIEDFLVKLEMLSGIGVRYERLDPSTLAELPVVADSPAQAKRERSEQDLLQWFEAFTDHDRDD